MTHKILLLPGDGIGPEVVEQARRALLAIAARFSRTLEFTTGLIGGCAIDQTGQPLPPETLDLAQRNDAVLLGAVGGPKWDDPAAAVRPEQGLLALRKALGVFANLRPVRIYPELADITPLKPDIVRGVDLLFVRELTGGLYFGARGRRTVENEEHAFDTLDYGVREIERVIRVAAALARTRRRRLTSIDKANVLESSRLWRATATRTLRDEFPDVQLEHVLVDSAAMFLIQQPTRFDVLVTENMFGDILTDEASVLAGSMGLLPSASLGAAGFIGSTSLGAAGPGLYEPIHGSAPSLAGRNVANPIGTILSAALLCRHSLNWPDAATCIENAVASVIAAGLRTADLAPPGAPCVSTAEMGARVAALIRDL